MLQLKSPYHDGSPAWRPEDGTSGIYGERLAALVPRPRLHLIRFHGVLAPNAKLRPQIIPTPPANATDPPAGQGETLAPSAPARIPWAQLLKRVFAIDIEQCPHCGGTLAIIAAILDSTAIAQIGLSARAPPRSPARHFALLQTA